MKKPSRVRPGILGGEKNPWWARPNIGIMRSPMLCWADYYYFKELHFSVTQSYIF